ncbi:MAG: hypothetical protein JJE13_05110 [Thermoleophilia bacterium]|nr:hypothetical protein [Thermoleophilia bacterium]
MPSPDLPRVPLEAGAGPDNPPCPACGEPLFPWVGLPVGTGMAHRCEACGLGALSRTGVTADALADLDRGRGEDGRVTYSNRASLQAMITGGAWSGLGTDRAYRFTPESLRRLVSNRDQVVSGSHWKPGAGIASMWQSGINMFTFGHNVALAAFGGAVKVPARRGWQRGLDVFISVVLAVPAIVIAVPAELIGALFRRGGEYRVRFEVL